MCATIITILAIVGSTAAEPRYQTKLESELKNVLRERWAALSRGDAKAYGAFLDEDVVVPDNGLLYDKKALIGRVRTLPDTSDDPREVQVHGYGDSAVMVYRTTSRVPIAGQVTTEELRIVETYGKKTM
jgi:hypothetical protein